MQGHGFKYSIYNYVVIIPCEKFRCLRAWSRADFLWKSSYSAWLPASFILQSPVTLVFSPKTVSLTVSLSFDTTFVNPWPLGGEQ